MRGSVHWFGAPPKEIRMGYAVTGVCMGLLYSGMFLAGWWEAGMNIAGIKDPWLMPLAVGGVAAVRLLVDTCANGFERALTFCLCFLGAFAAGASPVIAIVETFH